MRPEQQRTYETSPLRLISQRLTIKQQHSSPLKARWLTVVYNLVLSVGLSALGLWSQAAWATPSGVPERGYTWTDSKDWSRGQGQNVEWDKLPGQIQLKSCIQPPTEAKFLYIPNSNQDTVVKLDARTGAIEWTFNLKPLKLKKWNRNLDPSRTTVDTEGNVWVGIRGGYHLVGISPTGKLLATIEIGKRPRAVAIDRNGDIWAGAYDAHEMAQIRKDKYGKYKIVRKVRAPYGKTKLCPYGAVTDLKGFVWVSSRCGGRSDNAVKIDVKQGKVVAYVKIPSVYGIAADRKGRVWAVSYRNGNSGKLWQIDADQHKTVKSHELACTGRGVAVDAQSRPWVACSHDENKKTAYRVVRIDPATNKRTTYNTVGRESIGIAVDADGHVWSIAKGDGKAYKQDANTGKVLGAYPTCDITNKKACHQKDCPTCKSYSKGRTNARPYSYSDMSGFQLIKAKPKPARGTWRVQHDIGCSAKIHRVAWTQSLPSDTSIRVKVRVANSKAGLATAKWSVYCKNQEALKQPRARWVELEFEFKASDCALPPVMLEASIHYSGIPEVCDGQDNDCDGKVDGLVKQCSSACGKGQQRCTKGTWDTCDAKQPETEICDGLDNDCDDKIDEGLIKDCRSLCGKGQQRCTKGTWDACDAKQPGKEVCDGQDNDCDGKIDDELRRPCRSACGSGTEICSQGKWLACDAPKVNPEVCDGQDNDCDGKADEGLTKDCRSACGKGQQRCVKGKWDACDAKAPVDEICNGKDDDCDGKVDDQAPCPKGNLCKEGKCVSPPNPYCESKRREWRSKLDWSVGKGQGTSATIKDGSLQLSGLCPPPAAHHTALYIPNSGLNTLTKLNSRTGKIEWTHHFTPLGLGNDPSRTTIDHKGNVWVGLRNSRHVIVLSPKGKRLAIVETGETPRALTTDHKGDVWVGNFNSWTMVQIDPNTYKIKHTLKGKDALICPYGATTDKYGKIWVSSRCGGHKDKVVKIDPVQGKIVAAIPFADTYGIAADRKGSVWVVYSRETDLVAYPNYPLGIGQFDAKTHTLRKRYPLNCRARGVLVGRQGKVWSVCSHHKDNKVQRMFVRIDPATQSTTMLPAGGLEMIGIGLDVDGYVWGISRKQGRGYKLDTNTAKVVASYPTCDVTNQLPCYNDDNSTCPRCTGTQSSDTNAAPYSFSQFGTLPLRPVPADNPLKGVWQTQFDTKCFARFDKVSWQATLPPGTQIEVRVRAALSQANLANALWSKPVGNGQPLIVKPGRWAEVQLTLTSTRCDRSPVLNTATLHYTLACQCKEADQKTIDKTTGDKAKTEKPDDFGFSCAAFGPAQDRDTSFLLFGLIALGLLLRRRSSKSDR